VTLALLIKWRTGGCTNSCNTKNKRNAWIVKTIKTTHPLPQLIWHPPRDPQALQLLPRVDPIKQSILRATESSLTIRGTSGSRGQVYVGFATLTSLISQQPLDSSANAIPLALLLITAHTSYLRSLTDVQLSRKSSARCLFRRREI
jgi:hypothetical protein